MKILKYLLIIVAILLVGGLTLVVTQPDSYDVKRTKLIKAPVRVIFNNLNEFKNWQKWGPWMEEDPSIVATYPKQTKGAGASYSWTSKEGLGNIKTVALVENKSIDQKIQFDDYEPTDVYWRLEEVEEGTNVTWGMKATDIPFMFKFFGAISGGMDAMLGPMEEKGLKNLDMIIMEELANLPTSNDKFRVGEISQKDMLAQTFIGYFLQAKIEDLPALFQEYMPKARQYAAENNLEFGDYIPAAVYTKYDEENGETEFYIGLMLGKEIAPAEGMETVEITAGNVVTLSKFGYYGNGDMEAHNNIAKYFENNNLEYGALVWELYINDPMKVKPEEIQTDIYYQVK